MLPPEVSVHHTTEAITYDFPLRPVGRLRWLGLLPILFGLFFAGIPLSWLFDMWQRACSPFLWVFTAFLSIFVFAALSPIRIGIALLAGRVRLTANRDLLQVTEITGPFHWTRKFKVAKIRSLSCLTGDEVSDAKGQKVNLPLGLSRLGAITAEMVGGKKAIVLMGYPKEWLKTAVEQIRGRLNQNGVELTVLEPAPPGAWQPDSIIAASGPPAGSNIQITRTADHTEVRVPARGVWQTSRSVFIFGLVWCSFVGFVTVLAMRGNLHVKGGSGQPVSAWLFLVPFWLIGLGIVGGCAHFGSRSWMLRARQGTLNAIAKSSIYTRGWTWPATQIQSLEGRQSNIEVNDQPLMELRVTLTTGKKVGLLRGRSLEELRWLAAVLSRELGV